MNRVVRCSECHRRMRSMAGWNSVFKAGVVVGNLCPDCQTPEQNAEAEINEATLDYGINALGLIVAKPKGAA